MLRSLATSTTAAMRSASATAPNSARTVLPAGFLLAHRAAPTLTAIPYRTTATTGCRRKKKKKADDIVDNRLLIKDAVAILNNREGAQPNHSIHALIKVRPEKGMPPLRGTLILPEKVPKKIRILCFAEGAAAEAAKAAGADIVGTTDLIEPITKGELQFDMVISTPESFTVATKVAKILGPKGLMPNVKKGTVTTELAMTIDVLKNSIRYTSGRTGDVRVTVGKVGFTPEQVEKNLKFVLDEVMGYIALAPGKKKIKRNKFVHKIWMNATFSPALPLRMTQFTF
ncbi:ribosomal protein L1 [Allomyces macrogynus ATCC 38327]|uniref:Ribosomal protein L1 n=1 Tax=Allomyces macrogynus (strain ATCC 38327) TaxID=578462 RepID=A0A0L0T2S9_ALLM3|nr:ribosomal protein L1 [Allomyces macrogynus ATCC 38327]|eukprot:KNE68914.1 ribosomal protein L1 [Allomyces macrogynus ATCC 38327]